MAISERAMLKESLVCVVFYRNGRGRGRLDDRSTLLTRNLKAKAAAFQPTPSWDFASHLANPALSKFMHAHFSVYSHIIAQESPGCDAYYPWSHCVPAGSADL